MERNENNNNGAPVNQIVPPPPPPPALRGQGRGRGGGDRRPGHHQVPPRNGPPPGFNGGNRPAVPDGRQDAPAPPPAPPKPVARLNSIAHWATEFPIPYPEFKVGTESPVAEYLKNHAYKVQPAKIHSDHPLSHCCRQASLLEVIRREGSEKTALTVLSYYGANRDNFLNASRPSMPSHGWLADHLDVSVTCAPNNPVAGDKARGFEVRRTLPRQIFDVVYVCDVYQDGISSLDALSPDSVRELIKISRTGKVYIVFRPFIGCAGFDNVDDYNGPSEGVWFRDSANLINFSPSSRESCYASHPDTNWLVNRHYDGLDIAEIKVIGPYRLVAVALTANDAIALQPMPRPVPLVDMRVVAMGGHVGALASFVSKWIPTSLDSLRESVISYGVKEIVLSHVEISARLSPLYSTKIPHGVTQDSLRNVLLEQFGKDQLCKLLSVRFPPIYEELFNGTHTAILYGSREANVQRMIDLRAGFGSLEPGLTRARSQAWVPGSDILELAAKKISKGLLLAVVVYLVLRRLGLVSLTASGFKRVPSLVRYVLLGPTTDVTSIQLRQAGFGWLAIFPQILPIVWGWISSWWKKPIAAPPNPVSWDSFVQTRRDCIDYSETGIAPIPVGAYLSGTPCHRPVVNEFRGSIKISIDQVPATLEEAFDRLDPRENQDKSKIYPLIMTNGNLYRPIKNDYSLLVALVTRVHAWPTAWDRTPEGRFKRHDEWLKAARFLAPLLKVHQGTFHNITECARLMGKVLAAKRLLRAYKASLDGTMGKSWQEKMLKSDETIPVKKIDVLPFFQFKPRIIALLDPIHLASTIEFARMFSDILKTVFDGTPRIVNAKAFRLKYAIGLTPQEMSDLGNDLSQESVLPFAVAGGDDLAARLGMSAPARAKNADADLSQYDASEDEGPLKYALAQFLKAVGCGSAQIELILWTFSTGYKVKTTRMTVRGEAGTQMASGSPFTSSVNSLNNLAAFTYAYLTLPFGAAFTSEHIEQAYAKLGFKLKITTHENFSQVTFLRGWWQPSVGERLEWCPLPSAVLKLGKSLVLPSVIYKERNLSPQDCYNLLARGMSLTFGRVPLVYPILGVFLSKMHSCDANLIHITPSTITDAIEQNPIKPRPNVLAIDREACLQAMCTRYNLEEYQILDCERLINSIPMLPCLIAHPVFLALRDVDYA